MAKYLVIVESPSKSKTIGQYLGSDFIVKSSKGHVRDLSISGAGGLGIDIANHFKPDYVVLSDKKAIVKELHDASKQVDAIYLATDPDREGEAISWHLSQIIVTKNKTIKRVIFNEITKTAILEAFHHPGDIDMNLVSSQETRRMTDRIIGFKLSKLLQSKIKSKSAGRVQSAALKLIVDRDREINDFVSEEYYEIDAKFDQFVAHLFKYDNKSIDIKSLDQANAMIASLINPMTVESLETKRRQTESKPPFITSTLQQDASNKLGFTSTKTMQIAQRLYEGIDCGNETIGLITYMRTDSFRLSQSFVQSAYDYIDSTYGKAYVGTYKVGKKGSLVQDAHEAIRPTDVTKTPEKMKPYLSKDEYHLYQLIYLRAISSLMKATQRDVTTLTLKSGKALFKTSASKIVFDGYLKAYSKFESDEESDHINLPTYEVGSTVMALEFLKKQCFTHPPLRYNEARLIKEMEDLGIGRPSTYAQTIQTLKLRKYVSLVDKKFVATEQGQKTIEQLDLFFKEFISATYSREMEDVLDEIASGKADSTKVLETFYEDFMPMVDNARKHMVKVKPAETGEKCPVCGHPMVLRHGAYGDFEACGNFPKCKYIKPNTNVVKPVKKALDTTVPCPVCHEGTLIERTATKGMNKGKKFYACSNYPKCKTIAPYRPTDKNCPKCGKPMIVDEVGVLRCIDNITCAHVE
jgi:DNA topoisomerase-1